MFTLAARKRQTLSQVRVHLEELEGRALLSSVQPLPLWHTVNSTNWSGYAAETNLTTPASNVVTSVSGSWTVPKVTGSTNAYSSVWVGIDGYSSNSVEQLGTEQDTSRSGATSYYAWWETYPNPSILISNMTISAGDSMTASVSYSSGSYTLYMKDNNTGQTFTTPQSVAAQRSSAEWIVEAPSSFSGVLPLANFGTAQLSGASATINGSTGAIDNSAWQNTAINMVNRSGTVIDQTSGLTDTTASPITSSFSVTYTGSSSGGGGHGHGHGPIQTADVAGPAQPGAQAAVAAAANSNLAGATAAASTRQVIIISTPAADSLVRQVNDGGSPSGFKGSWRGW
jgi:hypothetical protein